ncbi:MAG: recombinase family protein [Bacteroidia bacterium]
MIKKKNRVCLLVRVSTLQQDYDRQVLELNTYCKQQGYTIVKTIASKISGTKTGNDRPDIKELFEAVGRKQIDKVLVTEVSRIGRNARDIKNTISYLHDRGVSIIFKSLGLESLSADGKESFATNIILAIYSEMAQEEKRVLSERIRSGLISARAKGKHIGRKVGSALDREGIIKKYPQLAKDLKNGLSIRKACRFYNVSENTAIKVKRAVLFQVK